MISIQKVKKFLAILFFIITLTVGILISFDVTSVWAKNLSFTFVIQPQLAVTNRIQAVTRDFEGKAQEELGIVTNNPKDQMMGIAKQIEGQILDVTEDIKDQIQPRDSITGVIKDLEGKTQEAIGDMTGDIQDQITRQAKQVEGNRLGLVEGFRKSIRNLFD